MPEGAGDVLSFVSEVRFDPAMLEKLAGLHEKIRATFARIGASAKLGATAATADAVRACIAELHELNRLESLRLYPVIARQLGTQPGAMAEFTKLRLSVYGVGRKFLRVLEGAVSGVEGVIGAADLCLAATLLERYIGEKQAKLYPLYCAAPRDA